jgi:hypothetical protein
MFDTIPGVTFQVSCTRPMLPYIAKFFLPFIPSHSIIFSISFGFPHSQSVFYFLWPMQFSFVSLDLKEELI